MAAPWKLLPLQTQQAETKKRSYEAGHLVEP